MAQVLDPGRYFGTTVRSWAQGAFSLQVTSYAGAEHVPTHAHKLPYVCFVLDGAYRERSGVTDRACEAGTVVVHAGGTRHSDRFEPAGGTCLNVAWSPEGGAALLHRAGRALPVGSWRTPKLQELAVDLAQTALSRRPPREASVERQMGDLAEEIANLGAREAQRDAPPWVARIDAALEARGDEAPSVRDLARLAGVHRTTLLRAFWRHRGTSVRRAIRERRLDQAIEALLDSRDPIAELAQRCGFADQSHLCRALRAAMGTSPARVRSPAGAGRASCVQESASERP